METLELKPKRKYEKKKQEGKISIRHYQNTSLKGEADFNEFTGKEEIMYPPYFRVGVASQQTSMRSVVLQLSSKGQFDSDDTEFKHEANNIEYLIRRLKPFERKEFAIKEFKEIYPLAMESVSIVIKNLLYQEILREIENCKKLVEKGEFILPKNSSEYSTLFNPYDGYPSSPIRLLSHFPQEYNAKNKFLKKYPSQVWILNALEEMVELKGFYDDFYGREEFVLYDHPTLLIHYLKGEYQKAFRRAFEKEFDVSQIFTDINKIIAESETPLKIFIQ